MTLLSFGWYGYGPLFAIADAPVSRDSEISRMTRRIFTSVYRRNGKSEVGCPARSAIPAHCRKMRLRKRNSQVISATAKVPVGNVCTSVSGIGILALWVHEMGMDGSGVETSAVVAAMPVQRRKRSAPRRGLNISATEHLTRLDLARLADLNQSRLEPNWLQLLALARDVAMIAADILSE